MRNFDISALPITVEGEIPHTDELRAEIARIDSVLLALPPEQLEAIAERCRIAKAEGGAA